MEVLHQARSDGGVLEGDGSWALRERRIRKFRQEAASSKVRYGTQGILTRVLGVSNGGHIGQCVAKGLDWKG